MSGPLVSGTYPVRVEQAQPLFDPRYELPYLSLVLRITEGPFAGITLRDATREDPAKGPVGRLQQLAGDAETIGDLVGRTALATVVVRGCSHTPEILSYSQKDA